MTIVFIERPEGETRVQATCPACRTPQEVRADPGRTLREVCSGCGALFSVHLYPSGMVVIE